jgi:cobalt-zinc-cadmium resistance protein CzcA
MRQIVAFALQRKPLVILFYFAFVGFGLWSFTRLNIEAYPDPVPPQVVILTQNPGQSAEEIERYVTIPVEVAMAGVPNLTSVRSTSCSACPTCGCSSTSTTPTTKRCSRC